MNRTEIDKLIQWKHSAYRKPLILEGARQVGKTWLMREFGEKEYNNYVYIDFSSEESVKSFFRETKDPKRIIEFLALYSGQGIIAHDTLLIFDEIQECPEALNSLKYFQQDAPEYHVICAGSLLGVMLSNGQGAPVGKVDFARLGPLQFEEFLDAIGELRLAEAMKQFAGLAGFPDAFHKLLIEKLQQYYLIGGMPEAVNRWVETKDISQVRLVHQAILRTYQLDFSKHTTDTEQNRIMLVWNSIPSQLTKENKKFIYSVVRKGARAKDFEFSLQWIINAELLQKVNWNPGTHAPLPAYDNPNAFKTYLLDVGLLCTLAGVETASVATIDALFTEFKGGLSENFVCNHLFQQFEITPRYWSRESRAEVDFLLQYKNQVYPIEVKAGENVRGRSLAAFSNENNSKLRIRYSLKKLALDNNLLNIPLYMIGLSKEWIEHALQMLEERK
jgi:predicted AAA+ superfamily ATPase